MSEFTQADRITVTELQWLDEPQAGAISRLLADRDRLAKEVDRQQQWERAYAFVTNILPLDDEFVRQVRDPVCPMRCAEQDRGRVDRLVGSRDRLAEQCARLRSALEQLRDDANAADDSCYGTLATVHVHRICEEALNVCWQYRPGAPCPVPASCRENGCSAVEREDEARAALADEGEKDA